MEGEGDRPSTLLSELITADLIKTQNQYTLLPAAQKKITRSLNWNNLKSRPIRSRRQASKLLGLWVLSCPFSESGETSSLTRIWTLDGCLMKVEIWSNFHQSSHPLSWLALRAQSSTCIEREANLTCDFSPPLDLSAGSWEGCFPAWSWSRGLYTFTVPLEKPGCITDFVPRELQDVRTSHLPLVSLLLFSFAPDLLSSPFCFLLIPIFF